MRKDRRRRFLFASGAIVAAPLAALAQPADKARRIGILIDQVPGASVLQRLLPASLRRLGYEEGKNLVSEWRFSELKAERLPALAEQLARVKVEVIVAWQNAAIAAAKRATQTIPIVMHGATLPVENRFIGSLAHPGGNVTGTVWWDGTDAAVKTFQVLKDAVPRATRLTVIWDPMIADARLYDRHVRIAAEIGLTMTRIGMTRLEDLPAALDQVRASRPDVLYVSANPVFQKSHQEIAAFAREQRLVSISVNSGYVDQGGLLSYGPDLGALVDRTASYVDRILQGAKPADLPVENPAKFELAFNAKTARVIGFKPPQPFMVRVDRQVE